jgi:succinate dehydrogenase / fumarate reductase, cytochrome b subunit
MAEVAVAAESVRADSVHPSFLWRRLHSLSGLVPVGLFLCYHIYENMSALRGPEAYDEMVNKVNTLLPRAYFFGVEIAVILGPLVFHALYGLYIAASGQSNTGAYAYPSNWAYWMQRISGYVAFVYILVHVGILRFVVTFGGHHLAPYAETPGKLNLVTYNDVAAHLGNPDHLAVPTWMAGNQMFVIYLVGTVLTIYHFTNGLNGFAWTWGIAVGRVAQQRVKTFAWVLFIALSVATLNILIKMRFAGAA